MGKFIYHADGSWEFDDRDNSQGVENTNEEHACCNCGTKYDITVIGECENPNEEALTGATFTVNSTIEEMLEKIKTQGYLDITGRFKSNFYNDGIHYYYGVCASWYTAHIIPKEVVSKYSDVVLQIFGREIITNHDVIHTFVGMRSMQYDNLESGRGNGFAPRQVGLYIIEDDTPDSPTYGKVICQFGELPQ